MNCSKCGFKTILIIFIFLFHKPPISLGQQIFDQPKVDLHVDGSKRFQRIDGIGVNANTRSWNGKDLEPALNLLLDSMHASIWRVIVESVEKWEDVNDNDDPFTFNWHYYDSLYETPKFQKVWNMIAYLNKHGVTDNLMINFMGFAPRWMGIKVIEPKYEDEFVEMLVSFFYYGIQKRHLQIGLIGPTNESDWYNYSEGPHLNGPQLARIIHKMIERMQALGIMGNIRLVVPDVVVFKNATESYIPALMEDTLIWGRVAHLGFHSYGGYEHDIQGFIKNSPYPETTYWVTEWNAWCNGCDDGKVGSYDYDYAKRAVKFLLQFLQNGATGCLAFEAYDSYYEHHAPSLFSYWGILAYNANAGTYTPRKNFYAFSQVSKFVPPGAWRINTSYSDSNIVMLAFYDSLTRRVTVAGINLANTRVNIRGVLANLPAVKVFQVYHTDSVKNLHKDIDISVKNKSFETTIPADCIFTITGVSSQNKGSTRNTKN